jgi:divalent metal cation (Fe/Co/Zn/Cd) transporter
LVLAVLLVVVGVVVVLLNYGGALPGGTQDNYMYLGLGVVAVGVVWTIALLLARRRDPSRG